MGRRYWILVLPCLVCSVCLRLWLSHNWQPVWHISASHCCTVDSRVVVALLYYLWLYNVHSLVTASLTRLLVKPHPLQTKKGHAADNSCHRRIIEQWLRCWHPLCDIYNCCSNKMFSFCSVASRAVVWAGGLLLLQNVKCILSTSIFLLHRCHISRSTSPSVVRASLAVLHSLASSRSHGSHTQGCVV